MSGNWPAQAFAKQMRHVSCNLGCSVSQLPKGVERPVYIAPSQCLLFFFPNVQFLSNPAAVGHAVFHDRGFQK